MAELIGVGAIVILFLFLALLYKLRRRFKKPEYYTVAELEALAKVSHPQTWGDDADLPVSKQVAASVMQKHHRYKKLLAIVKDGGKVRKMGKESNRERHLLTTLGFSHLVKPQ